MSGILLLLLGGIAVWIGVKGSEGAIWTDLFKTPAAGAGKTSLDAKTTTDPMVPATPAGRVGSGALGAS